MSSIMRARNALTGRWEGWEVIGGVLFELKVAGPSMLGIRCPDRHPLPLIHSPPPPKMHPPRRRPPARAGSFNGRVGVWRSGGRPSIAVAAPFVWRCLTGSTVAPFPHPPGHRRRSPAPGSHRTWRADFPHQRSSAVASQHCKRLQLPVGEAQFRCQQRCPFFDSIEGVPGEAAAGPAAAAQHPAPATLHDPIYLDETPEISGDAVISIVAA